MRSVSRFRPEWMGIGIHYVRSSNMSAAKKDPRIETRQRQRIGIDHNDVDITLILSVADSCGGTVPWPRAHEQGTNTNRASRYK